MLSPVKHLSFANGSKAQVSQGRIVCDQFTGLFTERSLQAKSNTGLWYARATGTGIALEGEGATPELAIYDLKLRARAMREELALVYAI